MRKCKGGRKMGAIIGETGTDTNTKKGVVY